MEDNIDHANIKLIGPFIHIGMAYALKQAWDVRNTSLDNMSKYYALLSEVYKSPARLCTAVMIYPEMFMGNDGQINDNVTKFVSSKQKIWYMTKSELNNFMKLNISLVDKFHKNKGYILDDDDVYHDPVEED